MKQFGLIGYPLTHSFSKKYFSQKFIKLGLTDSYSYENFPLPDIRLILELVASNSILYGLNVTIPYKTMVIPFLNQLSEEAAVIGAVNTIRINRNVVNGTMLLKGFNTDVNGVRASLDKLRVSSDFAALVLGTGGASKAVCFELHRRGIDFKQVSRDPAIGQLSYEEINAEILKQHKLLINTTPCGMFPEIDTVPLLPYEFLEQDHVLWDIVYNPSETVFIRHGKRAGATTMNGELMLFTQAEAAWEIWNDPDA